MTVANVSAKPVLCQKTTACQKTTDPNGNAHRRVTAVHSITGRLGSLYVLLSFVL